MDKLESFHFDEALLSSNESQPLAPGKWDHVAVAATSSNESQQRARGKWDHVAVAATPQAQPAWPTPHQFSSGKSRFAATRTAQPTLTAQRHLAQRDGFWPGGRALYSQCAKCSEYLPTGCFGDWMLLLAEANKNRQSNRNHQKQQCDACLANWVPKSFADFRADGDDCSATIDKHRRQQPID